MRCHFLYLFVILFCSQIVFPFSNLLAFPSKQTSLVVYPLQKGSFDAENQKIASILRERLKEKTALYVVDPKNVESVLKYYENFSLSSKKPSIKEAKELVSRAKEHYFQFAYLEAEAELKKVFQIFEQDPSLIFSDGQLLADGQMVLGLVEAAQKKKQKAMQAFQEVFRIAPLYQPDPKLFSPSIRRLFRKAKTQIGRQQNPGTIRIEGFPKVTDVYLNGIYQGVSPMALAPLPPGEYALSFKAHHYGTMQRRVNLKAGEEQVLQHKLYWQGPKKRSTQKTTLDLAQAGTQIEEGLRIADLLKVDKVLLLSLKGNQIHARLVDRKFRAGHKPVILSLKSKTESLEESLDRLVPILYAQTKLNLLKNPQAYLDPLGFGDPILLRPGRRKIPKGILFGGIGAMGVGGILAAVLTAGGGSTKTPGMGSIVLSFK